MRCTGRKSLLTAFEAHLISPLSQEFVGRTPVLYRTVSVPLAGTIRYQFPAWIGSADRIFGRMQNSPHILVVDDHREMRILVGQLLEKECAVHWAIDAST